MNKIVKFEIYNDYSKFFLKIIDDEHNLTNINNIADGTIYDDEDNHIALLLDISLSKQIKFLSKCYPIRPYITKSKLNNIYVSVIGQYDIIYVIKNKSCNTISIGFLDSFNNGCLIKLNKYAQGIIYAKSKNNAVFLNDIPNNCTTLKNNNTPCTFDDFINNLQYHYSDIMTYIEEMNKKLNNNNNKLYNKVKTLKDKLLFMEKKNNNMSKNVKDIESLLIEFMKTV